MLFGKLFRRETVAEKEQKRKEIECEKNKKKFDNFNLFLNLRSDLDSKLASYSTIRRLFELSGQKFRDIPITQKFWYESNDFECAIKTAKTGLDIFRIHDKTASYLEDEKRVLSEDSNQIQNFLSLKKDYESRLEVFKKIMSLFTVRFDEVPNGTIFWCNYWCYSFDRGMKIGGTENNTLILQGERKNRKITILSHTKVLIDPTQ